ncbi:MAG: L-arabinose isomerase, partial [Lachnospiraceae bacterium]|nr:L-arabinose isomerase [Lachnospiraceae bacterium]
MSKLYFIVGSQDLYGEECLKQVAADAKEMVEFLGEKLKDTVEIELLPTVETSELCVKDIRIAENDDDCVGVITWMHTFSPAKMWIKGLQILRKPLLHLHTQYNEKLPYDSIDMDFMNLNQAAHGDREYGFILAKLGIPHEVVAGYYEHEDVLAGIRRFAEVAKAIGLSKNLTVATFGNNMRDVAVTDGNRLE